MDKNVIPGDGVVTGHERSMEEKSMLSHKISRFMEVALGKCTIEDCKVLDAALKTGRPVIGMNDSGGARIQEGVASLGSYAEIFLEMLEQVESFRKYRHHGSVRWWSSILACDY